MEVLYTEKELASKIISEIGEDITDYGIGEIIRYVGRIKIKKESVAEHSFMVALIIIKVGNLLELPSSIVNNAVTQGVLHDMHEQYFGDLLYDFKSREEFKSTVKDLENRYNKIIYEEKYKDTFGTYMYDTLFKHNNVEDRLVKLADRVSALQYATREIKLGNTSPEMIEIVNKSKNSILYDVNRLFQAIEKDKRLKNIKKAI